MRSLIVLLLLCLSSLASETGVASYYSTKSGSRTASGERLNDSKLTAAHKRLPFGTLVKVKNLRNNKEVVVKITDRGPFKRGRVIDLSIAAAKELGMMKAGLVKVQLEIVESIRGKGKEDKREENKDTKKRTTTRKRK